MQRCVAKKIARVLLENIDESPLENKLAIIDAKNDAGFTPLHIACLKSRPEIITLLIEFGADIEILDNEEGKTPLNLSDAVSRMEVIPPKSSRDRD
jgi:ankyrin repeat protein